MDSVTEKCREKESEMNLLFHEEDIVRWNFSRKSELYQLFQSMETMNAVRAYANL